MKNHSLKTAAAALLGVVGLALSACADYRPNPTYNNGVAYVPPPCSNCA